MPSLASITDTNIQDFIVRALESVSTTMIREPVRLVEKTTEALYEGLSNRVFVLSRVGFIGEINGSVHLCIPDEFAQHAAATVLGMTPAEVAEGGHDLVHDVIGEITNVTVGGFKNALCDLGFPCKLTLPTVVRGDGVQVASLKGMSRHIFQFDCGTHRIVADIQMKD